MAYLATVGVYNLGFRFRLYLFLVFGILAFGSVMYWRMQLMLASEYVEFPIHKSVVTRVNLDPENINQINPYE